MTQKCAGCTARSWAMMLTQAEAFFDSVAVRTAKSAFDRLDEAERESTGLRDWRQLLSEEDLCSNVFVDDDDPDQTPTELPVRDAITTINGTVYCRQCASEKTYPTEAWKVL